MNKSEVARLVLHALGGRDNVLTNAVCMTRLRITLANPSMVDFETLGDIQGVLGTALRGQNGIEVVFGPRVIDEIYRGFTKLTGISASPDDLFPMSRQKSSMNVQIRTNKGITRTQAPKAEQLEQPSTNNGTSNDSDIDELEDLLNQLDSTQEKPRAKDLRLLVINGPNINMLGVPTANSSNADDYPTLLELCKQTAQEAGFARCDCFQSNHEGDLVDIIQDAYGICDAIVINPGAYGSSSALKDALRAVDIPAIEVHLHKLGQNDAVADVCVSSINGLGVSGYSQAIRNLAAQLRA